MNIIANAVVNGNSIFFASKNNKAVDNVKERLDEIIKEPYLMRFGSKKAIEDTAIPQIKKLISKHSQGDFNDKAAELASLKNEIISTQHYVPI